MVGRGSVLLAVAALAVSLVLPPAAIAESMEPAVATVPITSERLAINGWAGVFAGTDGSVWGWGNVGDGIARTITPELGVVRVPDLDGTRSVSAGQLHLLALQTDGTVWAWGYNDKGQLGFGLPRYIRSSIDPLDSVRYEAVQVLGLTNVVQVAAAFNSSLALKSDGTVWAWGSNQSGLLGVPGAPNSFSPIQVPGLPPIKSIAAGTYRALALAVDGTVWQWGQGVMYGTAQAATQVDGLTGVTAVAAGDEFGLALQTDGRVMAWGRDYQGQLGDGLTDSTGKLVQVSGLSAIHQIVAGRNFSFAIDGDGSLWAWGENDPGKLGTGNTATAYTPVKVTGVTNLSGVAAGPRGAVAVTASGEIWAWGETLGSSIGPQPKRQTLPSATTPPTWATGSSARILAFAGTVGTVVWPATTKPETVFRYSLFVDGKRVAVVPGSERRAVVPGLMPGRSHTVTIYAQDRAGNWSTQGLTATAFNWSGRLSAAGNSSYMVQSDGQVMAWGENAKGQLGNGSLADAILPTPVNVPEQAVMVTSVGHRSLALGADGTAWEWGSERAASVPVPEPRKVGGLPALSGLAAGPEATYGVGVDGRVWGWQGVGASASVWAVGSVRRQRAVVSGQHVMALDESGALALAGSDTSLGRPITTMAQVGVGGPSIYPGAVLAVNDDGTVSAWGPEGTGVPVSGLADVTMVARGGAHGMALRADGTVWTWGENSAGQLGDGSTTNRTTPVKVPGLIDVVAIATGTSHSLAMTADGTVWAWGSNEHGQLGDGTQTERHSPVPVSIYPDSTPPEWPGGATVTPSNLSATGVTISWPSASDDRAVASYHVYVNGLRSVRTSATSIAFTTLLADESYVIEIEAVDSASNASRRLTLNVTTPALSSAEQVEYISLTGTASFARTSAGLWVWDHEPGWSTKSSDAYIDPVLEEPTGLVEVAVGGWHALGLTSDGTVWAWGSNETGQLGRGYATDRMETSAPVPELSGVKQVAAADKYSVVLKNDGTVWSWGYGWRGGLGTGVALQLSPVQVPGLTDVVAIATQNEHTIALKSDGTVWGWGSNALGELGGLIGSSILTPVRIPGISGVTAIATGQNHSLALTEDGEVWGWGANHYGQVGQAPTDLFVRQPTRLNISGITAVAAGQFFSVALQADGTVLTWGRNDWGQLGDGQPDQVRYLPQPVPGLEAVAISAAGSRGLALRKDKTIFVWGAQYLDADRDQAKHRPKRVEIPAPQGAGPTWPAKSLTVGKIASGDLQLTWTAAQSSGSVAFYRIYGDGKLLSTVGASQRTYVLSPEAKSTREFQVQARDAWGNWSTDGPTVTAPPDTEPPHLLGGKDGKPALSVGMETEEGLYWVRPTAHSTGKIDYVVGYSPSYRFQAMFSEPLSRIVINGKDVEFGYDAPVTTFPAPLEESGLSSLTIELYDLVGNRTLLPQVNVLIDEVAPTVTITAVEQSESNGLHYATLTGTASKELRSLQAWHLERDELLVATSQISGKNWSLTVELPEVDPGTAIHLLIVATDTLFNVSEPDPKGADQRTIYVGKPPVSPPALTSPILSDGTLVTTDKKLTLKGKAELGTTVKAILGAAAPVSTAVDRKGNFSLTLTLPEGTNPLTLWAEDKDGRRSEPLIYAVTKDTIAPLATAITLRVRRGAEWSTLEPTRGSRGEYLFSLQGADEYQLEGTFNEALSSVTVGGKTTGVTLSGSSFTAPLTGLRNGSNSIRLAARDAVGNTGQPAVSVSLDMTAPSITASLPRTDLTIGAVPNQTEVVNEFSGTATEPLKLLRIIDQATGTELALPTTIQFDARDARKWKAQVTFPLSMAQSWALRFEGEDLAGNRSRPDSRGKDQRRVTVDPALPVVTLNKDLPDLIYTNGNDAWATKGRLTLSGTVSDAHTGIKHLVIGPSRLTPPRGKENSFDFSASTTLRDGALTTIEVYAEDQAGNRSPVKTIRLLYRSKISKLSAKAGWSRTTQRLTITGSTDLPFKVGDQYLGVVPIEITIKDKQGAEIDSFMLDGSTLSGYDFAKGSFMLTLANPDLPNGEYTITVTAFAPESMPWLTPRTVTTKVKIQR